MDIGPKVGKKELKKDLSPELKAEVNEVINNVGPLMKDAIRPIEMIVTDFAAEMLKTLNSIFILDNKKETERLSQEIEVAIQNIKSSDKKGDIEFLNRQLEKLKGVDSISSAVEGFAFSYKGHLYKFTGKFAPVNQILGLSKYGRGSKSSDEELTEASNRPKKYDVALLGGGFKPSHKGHIELIKQLASKADHVIVLTSDVTSKDRTFKSGQLKGQKIDGAKSNKILKQMLNLSGLSNVELKITPKPLSDIFDYVKEQASYGETILLGVGDKEDDASRFANIKKFIPQGSNIKVDIEILKPISFGGAPLSASRMREIISNGNLKQLIDFIPDEVANKTLFAQQILDTFLGKKSESEEIQEEVYKLFTEDNINEMSAVGGGAITGYAALFGKTVQRKKKMKEINRQQFMQELQLRKMIRKALVLREEKKKAVLQQEQLLRKELRKIIMEAKEDFNYGNTGLNKLGAWLKVKIPIIKAEYKDLATDKSQRDAFRARLMQLSSELFDDLESKIQAGIDGKSEELEEDVNVSLDGPDINDKILPVVANSTTPQKKTKKSKDEFKIEPTGEGEASAFFDDYDDELSKIYVGLNNPEDRKKFKDYYMSNLPAIMDQAEGEVSNVAKPVDTTPPEGAQTQQPASEPVPDQEGTPAV